MHDEIKSLHEKLYSIIEELAAIKKTIQSISDNSPPLSIQQAADYLHLSTSRVYDLVYADELKPLQHRKHGRILFSKHQLNQYLYENNQSISTEVFPQRPSTK